MIEIGPDPREWGGCWIPRDAVITMLEAISHLLTCPTVTRRQAMMLGAVLASVLGQGTATEAATGAPPGRPIVVMGDASGLAAYAALRLKIEGPEDEPS